MTENQAFLIDAVVGVPLCLFGVWLVDQLGAGHNVQLVAAMMAIVLPSLGVGLIGRHYHRLEIEREEAEDGGDPTGG